MKKTIKISLGHRVFYVDEDAYEKLQEYLSALGDRLKGDATGEEVIKDLESRIGELFSERLSGTHEVITVDDVIYVISVLGDPSEIVDEEEPGPKKVFQKGRKRLYRDPGNAVLGGVCGGLGNYFSIDPVWFRILFVVLLPAYGISLWLYIIIWIVVPEARSSSQKLEMSGEKVTIENLEKSVKQEYANVKGRLKKQSVQTRKSCRNATRKLGVISLGILRVFVIILGVLFILIGFFSLVIIFGVLLFKQSSHFDLQGVIQLFTDPANVPYIITSLILTVIIPLLALIYAGFKLVFRIRTKDGILWAIVMVVWFISAVTFFSFGVNEALNYSNQVKLSEKKKIRSDKKSTLYLKINDDFQPDLGLNDEIITLDNSTIYRDESSGNLYGEAAVFIARGDADTATIEIWRKSKGKNKRTALKNAELIDYHWIQRDSSLLLDPYFDIGTKTNWRDEEVTVKINIPEGMHIYIGKDLASLLDHADGFSHWKLMDLADKECMMTEDGLHMTEN